MEGKLKENRHRLSLYVERFTGLSPLRKLNQGFSYVADQEKRTLTSVKTGKKRGYHLYICNRWNYRSKGEQHQKGGAYPCPRIGAMIRYWKKRLWRRLLPELDGLAEKLEDRETSLEDSFRFYRQGMELLKFCSEKLDTVEKRCCR